MLLVFFILPERNLIMDNTVLGGKEELLSPINYCFNFKWGSEGSANGQFLRPHDVILIQKEMCMLVIEIGMTYKSSLQMEPSL
jgi:hypothetical protein